MAKLSADGDETATYAAALAALPPDAKWSSSFGYPGEGGYCEYHRTPTGERWTISNGPHDAFPPFTWHCRRVDERPRPHLTPAEDSTP